MIILYSNGYFKQPNDLQDALYKVQISGRQSQILNLIIRLTIGWQKTESRIANMQIAELTGLRVNHVTREINCLAKRKIIFVGTGHCHLIKINTDYAQWVYKKAKSLAMAIPTARVITATIPKFRTVEKPARKVTPAWFKEFWRMYPAYRRGGNYSFGWKKWQSLGLTQDDASKAKEWLLAAAKVDAAWAQDAISGFAFGLARFINESHWLTPMPVKPTSGGYKPLDPDNMDYTKGWDGFDVVGR